MYSFILAKKDQPINWDLLSFCEREMPLHN
jgi:hypothetical protein